MKAEIFTPFEGDEINIKTEEGKQVALKLEEVDKLEGKDREDIEGIRSEPFTLLYSGSKKELVADQIIEVSLDESGETHKMFLKKLDVTDDRVHYESIIN